ncbi:hypothetical protein KC19_12G064900 [Ceratodon purpureus]|uniref:Uncharacterized protein n=1 Tax=Ceratodon purpureus TaxID=3225 RepID=A0A8T0G6L6_CERPU|nr:hypothetical protein KC19_12G064900 [Ceratodon purpureus]
MAEHEVSVECSGEHVEVTGVSIRGEEGNNLSQNSSGSSEYLEAFGGSEDLGDLSSGPDIVTGDLKRVRVRFGENISKDIGSDEHDTRSSKASEDAHFSSSQGERKSGLDVRFGGCDDWESREQHSKSAEKDFQVYHNELVPSASHDKPGNLETVLGQVAGRLASRASWGEKDDTDQLVSSFLLKQLRNLAIKERDLEDRLSHERIEHVVEKVEGEVEFEQVINEMWFSMQADDEAQEMERRERDFEMERREVQLEEEVRILQGKVRRLEDELRLSHSEKDLALQKKQDEMDDIIQSMLGDMRESEDVRPEVAAGEGSSVPNDSEPGASTPNRRTSATSQKAIVLAFEYMLKEANERAKQDRYVIDSTLHAKENLENELQEEKRKSLEKERHLESRLLAMEKEVNRLSGVLREADLALSVEQERRKEARVEVDQVLDTWKEEKRIRGEYEDKAKRLLSFMVSIKEKLATGDDAEEDVTSRLASVSKDLDKELQRMSSKRFSTKRSKLLESEQSTRWKSQRDAAVAERDNLEEKLNLHLRRARDRESEIEAMWVERERNLVTKCSSLEAAIAHWESKYKKRDTEVMQEKKLSEMELEAHRKQWADEKTGWEAFVLQREQWVEEQVSKWTSLLEAKDRELTSLRKELEELEVSFKNIKLTLENAPQQVHDDQKQMLENSSQTNISCESYEAERNSEESEGEGCQSVEKFVHEIDTREEPDIGVENEEKLRLEKEELEKELSRTLKVMDELRTEIQDKKTESDAEKKNLEAEITSKSAELDNLAGQLNTRERQMETLMQKFRDEVLSIDREVEKERKEREEVMEMHFVAKRRLLAEIREKEERWQNDLEAITQELLESREWARQKDEDIIILKEDLQALDELRKAEEQRLTKRIYTLMKEKDIITAALDREQKAREEMEAEFQRLEGEHRILLENLNAETDRSSTAPKLRGTNWSNADLQAAVDRVANMNKQIAEAMTAIESLKEELDTKEAQLVQAKMDKEAEWKKRHAALDQEHKEMLYMREQQWQQRWMRKEQELLSVNDTILGAQREEIAALQGALKELEWSIMHGDMDIKAKFAKMSNKEGMVQVHTSHLEEVDQYVLELQKKLEESEKKRKSAEITASVRELKRVSSFDVALIQGDRDGRHTLPNMVRHDGHLTSPLALENGESLRIRTRSSPGHRSGRSSFSSIREIQADSHWEVENSGSGGRHGGNVSSSTWHGQPRDDFTLSVPPVSPGRRQQKWLVDAAWLENVRKEQAFLRQQLEMERQRVCSFDQLEAENRLIEAAIVRAVEEKHESESKVMDLQQEVILLKKMLTVRSQTSS